LDWPRARSILLVAFTIVNLVLAYSLWGPDTTPALAEPSGRVQVEQIRARLSERGIILPTGVLLPPTPEPMRFLRVEYRPDLNLERSDDESYHRLAPTPLRPFGFDGLGTSPEPTLDPDTQAVIYRPEATGRAAQPVDMENEAEVRQVAEDYLEDEQLMPDDAYPTGIIFRGETALVEFVPLFEGTPVFSGYTRVEVSKRGIETITQFWVRPRGYKDAPPKAVRTAADALFRLAGHLERSGTSARTILDVRLGYYAGRSLTVPAPDAISSWETVPVWRIHLDNGAVYFVNAFNGELES